MLLNFLRMSIGAPYVSDLKYSTMWKQVLICEMSNKNTIDMFNIYDWQEALLYLTGEELNSDDYRVYLDKLIQ